MFKKARNLARQAYDVIDNTTGQVVGIVGGGLMIVGQSAHAALPTEATAAFTALSSNVTDILAAVWPIAALATGGFVLLRLFKKGANRAV
jgi:major coat protein